MAKITFKPPTGAVPEGTAVNDTFDLVCTFRLESGGKACLVQMGDHDMPGYGEKGEKAAAPKPDYSEEATAMAGAGAESAPSSPGPDYG